MGPEADALRSGQGAASARRERRDVHRAGRAQPAVATRPLPAADGPRRVGRDRARRDPARAPPERAARRSLRRATRAEGQGVAAGARVRQSAIPAAVREHRRARQPASALHRVRPRALGGRTLVGAQRPYAGAVGRGLRARESRRVVAVIARGLRGAQRAPARELLPLVHAAILEPRQQRYAGRGVPIAGPVDAELFRARVPRALSRLQRRRRLGPHGSRRPRVS